jgi:isopenicillin N synthase-like dioxygenase
VTGTIPFTSIPIVDITGLRSPDRAERERVAADIGKAAREIGFLYISGTGIDEALFARMLAATKAFFALPVEEKMRSYIGLSS